MAGLALPGVAGRPGEGAGVEHPLAMDVEAMRRAG